MDEEFGGLFLAEDGTVDAEVVGTAVAPGGLAEEIVVGGAFLLDFP